MDGYGDAGGGLPPGLFDLGPDLGSLAYPWDGPPAPPAEVPAEPSPPAAMAPDPAAAAPPPGLAAGPGPVPMLGGPPPALDANGLPPYEPPPPAAEPDLTPPAPQGDLQAYAPPDALTGAGGSPGFGGPATATPDQRYAQVADHYTSNPSALLDRLTSGPIDGDTQRYLDEFARRDPAGFGELQLRMGDARAKHLAAEQVRIANADYETQKANLAIRDKAIAEAKAKSAQIDAEATAIANTKVGYHPTTLQRIAGVIAAVVGGLYQGRTGSARNPGLDALNEVINRDIEQQRSSLVNRRDVLGMRRTALADQYARSGDMYQASEVSRLAALKHADDLLATQQQNFAPDGTRGIQIASLRAGIAGQVTANQQARDQKLFENSVKAQGAVREQQQADEIARHNRATEGIDYLKLDVERSKSDKGPTFTPEQWAQIHPDNPAPPIAMNSKDYGAFLTERKTGAEIANQSPENLRGIPGVTVTNAKTGKPETFVATGRPEFIEAAKKKKAAVTKIASLLDDAVRTRSGWTTDTGNSEERQQLNTIWNTAQLEVKEAYTLGQISESDARYMNGVLGTSDPSKLRDPIAGIRKARQIFENNLNVDLHAVGLPEEQHYKIPDMSSPVAPKESVDDRALKMVLGDPVVAAKANYDPAGAPRPAHGEAEPFPEQQSRFRGDTAATWPDYKAHGVLLQRQQLDEWARRARDPSAPGHDEALTSLADAAGRAGGAAGASTAEVRDYARQLLQGLVTAGIDATPSAAGGR